MLPPQLNSVSNRPCNGFWGLQRAEIKPAHASCDPRTTFYPISAGLISFRSVSSLFGRRRCWWRWGPGRRCSIILRVSWCGVCGGVERSTWNRDAGQNRFTILDRNMSFVDLNTRTRLSLLGKIVSKPTIAAPKRLPQSYPDLAVSCTCNGDMQSARCRCGCERLLSLSKQIYIISGL